MDSFSRCCRGVLSALFLLCCLPAAAEPEQSFAQFLDQVRQDAVAAGIDDALLEQTLGALEPIPHVLELDRKQPEFTLSFADYMARVVNPKRVTEGRRLLAENRRPLNKIAAAEGVPAAVILAMWGIESDYGRLTGSYQVVPALATLAYDGRRSQYFRGELLKALTMVARGVPAEHMRGSWAGAMGQCQFMPSTYLAFAKSFDGQTPPDIWSNTNDVWTSTAHYLAGLDWRRGESWGLAVRLPKRGIAAPLFGLEHGRALKDWSRLGVRRADGRKLGGLPEQKLALIHIDGGKDGSGGEGPAFLVGDNFRALLHWNRSFFFAVAAGSLADRIASR
jgi:membrane-bound lytic murein transglycosylase B